MDGIQFLEKRIHRRQFKDEWPLTVPWAVMRCYGQTWLTVIADGREYALNGSSVSCGFPPIDPIWAGKDLVVPRKSLGPLFVFARDKLGHVTLSAEAVAKLQKPKPPSE